MLGAFFALGLGLAAAGCDTLSQPRAVPTFIPPAVVNPTISPVAIGGSQPVSAKGSTTVRVARGSIAQTVNGRGRISSAHEAFLYFPLKGVINQIKVSSGDQVTQGAPVAQLDTFDLEQDVATAQFDLDKANMNLRQAQAKMSLYDFQLEVASNMYTRTLDIRNAAWRDYQAIAPVGITDSKVQQVFDRFNRTDTDYVKAATDLNNLKGNRQLTLVDVDAANQAILHAQKKLEIAQTRLKGATLTAGFSGLIVSIDKNVGEEVQAYDPVGAIADPTQLQVEATISESDASSVGLGQAASVGLDGFPGQKLTGKVKEIASRPSIFQGQSVYRIVIAFDEASKVPATIRMGADISLILQIRNDTLVVPTRAVLLDGSRRYVTVVRGDNPQRVEVKVGLTNDTQSEILSGLAEGDVILVP